MTFSLVDSQSQTIGTELRLSVVETLKELMLENKKIVALDADLGGASGWTAIKKSNPDQFLNVGIAEANMMGVAAGLSLTGFTPFVHTFGPFATRRVFDQVYLSGGYSKNTINIFGSDPGFAAGTNGGTHTTWEDVALMRAIPNSVVCDAADDTQMRWIIKEFSTMQGVNYVRGNRKGVRNIYAPDSAFTIGKGNVIRSGSDVLIIATGQLVSDALLAAETLECQGISCEVIDMFTIKPLDKELVLNEVLNKKNVVTVENHSITGGLGSAVAEVLAENNIDIKLTRIGVNEQFGQVGSPDFLQKDFKLTSKDIVETINSLKI